MRFTLLIACIFIIVFTKQAFLQEDISKADNYFYGLELINASESYQTIFQNHETNDDDRALAGRKLAYISWHFYNELDKAREYVKKSIELEKYEAYLFKDLIDYEKESKNFEEAKKVYQQAISKLKSDKKLNLVTAAYADMVLNEAFENIKQNQVLDTVILNNAFQKIEIVNKKEPGKLKAAKIQLGLALLLKEGPKAMNAWQLYFNIPEGRKAKGMLTQPQQTLSDVLYCWNKSDLSRKDRDQLIVSLAASGFYEFAYFLNIYLPNSSGTENAQISDIVNYYEFVKQIENRIYGYYKDIALTNANNIKKVKSDIKLIQKKIWKALYWNDQKPSYSKEVFYEEIYKRFKAKIYTGTYSNICFYIGGHAIIDDTILIEQFGHTAVIQFVVLDQRFLNNYWGWFTGYYGFSGYANGEIIVQYREPAFENPVYYWNKISNRKSLLKWEEEIAQLSEQDNSINYDDENMKLSGVYDRIRFNIYSEILDSLKTTGLQNDDLRKAFISKYNEITNNHIINHEGRHAIDFNTLPKSKLRNDTELEFRATLSQIYFSSYPMIDIPLETNNTPHGLANRKLLNIISDWMDQNKNMIKGFDKNKPALQQLDLLTNKQIRNIIEKVEPFLN